MILMGFMMDDKLNVPESLTFIVALPMLAILCWTLWKLLLEWRREQVDKKWLYF